MKRTVNSLISFKQNIQKMAGCCEYGNKSWDSLKGKEFLD